MSTRILKEL